MKLDFSKLDFKKLNTYMFLFGVGLSLIASVITSLYFGVGFWILFISSLALNAVFFYRLNNGLIALLFGEFGVSMFGKHKNLFKHQLTESKTKELLNAVQHGQKSIIVHRKNTKSYYQIVKRKNSFFIKKCSSVALNTMITDFESSKQFKGKKNFELMFHNIKEIWYTVDTDNETVIYMTNGKRKFPMVPEFHVDLSELEEFLSFDGYDEKLFKETPVSEFERVQKENENTLIYNVVSVFASVFTIQCFATSVPSTNLWCSICKLVVIGSLWYFALLSFTKPEKYFYYNLFSSEKSSSREGYEFRQVSLLLISTLISLLVSVLNFKIYFTLSAIVFVISFSILFPKLLRKKRNNNKSANVQVLVATIFLAFVSFLTVFFVNNLYVKEKTTAVYSVSNYYYDDGTRYAYILVDGKEHSISADLEDYDENSPHIEATRITGLLGIEYIV